MRVVFRSGAKTWLRYIPVSQSRYVDKSEIKVMDAQAVDIPQINGKEKKKRSRKGYSLLLVTYCHESFAWIIASENMFLIS